MLGGSKNRPSDMKIRSLFWFTAFVFVSAVAGAATEWALPDKTGNDRALKAYFERKVAGIEGASQADFPHDAAQWPEKREKWRAELKDMLGLAPEPPKGDLKPVVTGTLEGDGYVIEKLHFQPLPKLYLAANLYRPKEVKAPLPTILYVCGHSHVEKDGVSFGNKTHYHHHGIWFAQHGYVCLMLDTVQWGEILGEHHGTYRLGRWWWGSRGYTPAGVEAWNCVRALDYLETRPEVDRTRFGVTGRSGGGAYSWWITAIDDRIKVACPTAGITTLHNHVVDGCVEGHCDCMFMNNFRRWDYVKVAALAAPRPLLILNTDKDDIFPLDGVYAIYRGARGLYKTLDAEKNIGLQIAEGPHQDLQPLNVGAFAWFERFLKGTAPMETLIEPVKPVLQPEQLQVFQSLPADEHTTRIDTEFVPKAPAPAVPADAAAWQKLKAGWREQLIDRVFGAWPAVPPPLVVSPKAAGTGDVTVVTFASEPDVPLSLVVKAPASQAKSIRLHVTEAADPAKVIPQTPAGDGVMQVAFSPRGLGAAGWTVDRRKLTHVKRRFMLIGETLEGQQVWDIRRAVQAVRELAGAKELPLEISASDDLAALAVYAALFEPGISALDLARLPDSHDRGPALFNVLRIFDLPQAVAMAAERCDVRLKGVAGTPWEWTRATAKAAGFPHRFEVQPDATLTSVRKIWESTDYCAFTDLIRHGDEWLCVFREGDSHVPGRNGTIRVLASKDAGKWESAASVAESGIDLRDPKISVRSDGSLMLLMGGSVYDGTDGSTGRKRTGGRGRVSFSTDGRTWTAPQPIGIENEWLWRVTWHQGVGYGVSYPLGSLRNAKLSLWRTTDGIAYEKVAALDPSGKSEPNETTLRFAADGTMSALVRLERGTRNAVLGQSRPPYTSWAWTDLGQPAQGPDFLPREKASALYAGRAFPAGANGPRTVFGRIANGRAEPLIVLPSGGDCSYPGMALDRDGSVLVSYYSSHEGRAAIYLARIALGK